MICPDGNKYSYKNIDQLANQFAKLLTKRNVQKGDHIFLFIEKSISAYVALIGCLKIGVVYSFLIDFELFSFVENFT